MVYNNAVPKGIYMVEKVVVTGDLRESQIMPSVTVQIPMPPGAAPPAPAASAPAAPAPAAPAPAAAQE